MRKKITIIGAGNVGATAAHWAVVRGLGDVMLLDLIEGVPQGKALDLWQSGPVDGFSHGVVGTNDYQDTAGSDIVIISAGLARKPGMSRDDLLAKNVAIVKSCTEEVVKYSPDCVLIVVTNPIDAMVYTSFKVSGFPRNRVIGMAGVLDSARYRTFLADALGVAPSDVNAMVMGIHGDNMLPMIRLANVAGIPITDLLTEEKINEIVKRTQMGGIEIVNHLKTGSAFYTPGLSAVEMAEAIVKDTKRVLPCAAYLEGEFGISGCFLGVPVVLGEGGVERIIEFDLTDDEKSALNESVTAVQNQMAATGL
ncbi:MAG: malate dehydrogenase [Proteobacteria bacterium]|nr:malate dehydrogenase [Pseudomonadota bacterium]